MKRHALKLGEYYAIKADAIQRDADGFFLSLGPETPPNESHGTVCIVHVRGALMHFDGEGGDSYEAILRRVANALAQDKKPSAILFRIESPGGVVAGLNECVLKLRRMSKDSGVRFVAFVDEMAASAAYALCCACSEVLVTPSSVLGSIGVISTMASQAEADKRAGLDYRLITSGARKADGHPHVPITDAAENAEAARVAELATQFFALASKARGVSPAKLEALQAAIYLGKKSVRAGLADDVITLDEALYGLDASEVEVSQEVAPNNGNQTDRRAEPLDSASRPGSELTRGSDSTQETAMAVRLDALIKRTEASIATEADPKKLAALRSKLLAFQATAAEMGGDDEPDGDEEPSKSDEAAKKAEKAKKAAEAAKHRAKAAEHKAKAAESEEAAKAAEEDDEEDDEEDEDSEARVRVGRAHADTLTPGAKAALESAAIEAAAQRKRLDKLEASALAREHASLVEEARAARRITPREAKALATKPIAFVRDFLEMRPKALVNVDEDAAETPDGTPGADLPKAALAMIDQGIQAMGLTGAAAEKYRADSVAAHRKASTLNGAGAY